MNTVETSEGALILDSHKLGYHFDRVQSWEDGEHIAPVSVDMALTVACTSSCTFCYAALQKHDNKHKITLHHALNLLDDFAEIGVKGVSLISDGESTLSPVYVPFIQHAKNIGIDVGNATNAWEWEPGKAQQVLPHLSWVRFTVAAGNPRSYARIMAGDPEKTHVFDRAINHIWYAVMLKKRLGLKVTLGIQMVLMPGMEDEILPFANLGLDLGVDYAVIKHCSDDEFHGLKIDYSQYEGMIPVLKQAESWSTDQTKIIVKWSKIRSPEPSYKRFHGAQFLLQISGSGLVAPSGMFFNQRYKDRFHIGNYTETRFKDLFKSDRYWDTMNYLASDEFDAGTMMGTLPIQHYVNVALDNHKKGVEHIHPARGEKPLHVNFL